MGMLISDHRRAESGAVGVASAADAWIYYPGGPIEVKRAGLIATTSAGINLATATSSFSVAVHHLAKTSGRTATYTQNAASIGTITFTTSAECGAVGAGLYVDTSSEITVAAGEAIVFEVTGAASAASQANLFVEFRDLPFTEFGRPTSAPGDGAVAGNIINMLKV